MAIHDKPLEAKIHCLFCLKTDCNCITPVVEQKTLKMRLQHIISHHTIFNRVASNADEKELHSKAIDQYTARLENLGM